MPLMLGHVMLLSAGALLVYVLALWLLSLPLHDVSIVDPGWGIGFVIVAWIAWLAGDGCPARRVLLVVIVSLWGLRLGGYLLLRKLGERREDPRYAEWRERHGARFPLLSLGMVFLFQGALIWVVSLPVQAAAPRPDALGPLDWIGVAAWLVGIGFEAVGDLQLSRFKADPANKGSVMDRGLWRYTRHPNYFGDFMVWWGIYLIALSTGSAWWSIVGPIVMSTLLIRVSGKGLLEGRMAARPGYAEYVERTSGFFPRPPRSSRSPRSPRGPEPPRRPTRLKRRRAESSAGVLERSPDVLHVVERERHEAAALIGDPAVLGDDERRPLGHLEPLRIDAVERADTAAGIREQLGGEAVLGPERLLGLHALGRDPHEPGAELSDLLRVVAVGAELLGADGGVVAGVEQQHDWLAAVLAEGERAVRALEREIRGEVASCQGAHVLTYTAVEQLVSGRHH